MTLLNNNNNKKKKKNKNNHLQEEKNCNSTFFIKIYLGMLLFGINVYLNKTP